MSNFNKPAKAERKTTTRIPSKATSTPRNFEAELIAVMKGASDAEYNEVLNTAKILRDCRDIIAKWRKAGLPDAALVEAIEAVVEAFKSTDNPTKAKAAARKGFNRVMRDAERAIKPQGASRGK